MCSRVPGLLDMKQKTKDNLTYVSVGLTIALSFAGYMLWSERITGTIPTIGGPILWGILTTPGIVALLLDQFWEFRRRPLLWGILAVAATINLAGIFIARALRWNPPVIMWSVITVPWFTIVIIVAGKLINPKRSRVPQR
jgi:drug/metabolite transporter (DMT)-like permease